MSERLKRYKPEFEYSYAFGVFAAIELLEVRPEQALRVIVSARAKRNEGADRLAALCTRAGVSLEIDDKSLERLSPRESHLAVGVFRKFSDRLDETGDHVVLYRPNDMGNVGSIARSMVAFGMKNLALIRPAADALAPRTIRASMGAMFRLAVEYFDDFDDYRKRCPRALYPLVLDAIYRMGDIQFESPLALMLGSEGEGIPEEIAALGTGVTIPFSPEVDSLNLSVAAGIALHEVFRQRAKRSSR